MYKLSAIVIWVNPAYFEVGLMVSIMGAIIPELNKFYGLNYAAAASLLIVPDGNGYIHVPQKPGLGISVDTASLQKYLVDVEIRVNGKQLYYTPQL